MKNRLFVVTLLGWLNFHLTAIAQPTVTTLPATGITATNATLNGSANPNGLVTTAYFQYGLTTNYGSLGGLTALPATNATLALPGLVVNSLTSAAGTNWTLTSAPSTYWQSIASSADGTRLAAVAIHSGGGIYTSTNAGSTWTQTSAPVLSWQSIAASADGTRLAAVVNGGGIYTSTNGGSTWTQTSAPGSGWYSIAASVDGTQLAAVVNGGGIYTSTNSGSTWTQTSALTEDWYSVASSADGTRLAAVVYSGGIYASTNSGATWTQTSALSLNWLSIAASADGTRLAAVASGGGIYTSTNSGTTWTQTSAPSSSWRAIASSADGSRLAAVSGGIYLSADGGGTWIQTSASSGNWWSIASSADGTQLAAVINYYDGNIYTSTGPAINLTPGTTYHFRAVGFNAAGTSLGNDLTFTTSQSAPTAITLNASGITATNATLNGSVTTGGLNTSAYFRYGVTTNYGSYSATNILAATNSILSVSDVISNLTPGVTYHFQLVATNSLGIALGGDLSFGPPAATTLAASGITATTATLNGTANPNGDITAVYFRYGLTASYGSYSVTNTLAVTNATLSVFNLLSSLASGTTYHFQLVASNSAGITLGGDLTFTTPTPPVVTTLSATSITTSSATLNASVNPGGATTTVNFQYGLTTNYDNYSPFVALPATNVTLNVPGQVFASLHGAAGANWTQTSTLAASSLASSADGNRLAAAVPYSGIYTSADGGNTWTLTSAPNLNWHSIASSADGARLTAIVNGGGIYTSTDSGATWMLTSAPTANWFSIASSADGTRLTAGTSTSIYTSTNVGSTWTLTGAPSEDWGSIASSADGTRLAAVVYGGGIYTSTNDGATWTLTSAPSEYWESIASSADGTRLAVAVRGGGIYASADGGGTWTQTSAPATINFNAVNWFGIASSADGTRLAAVVGSSLSVPGGGIYLSTDGGGTWTLTSAPNSGWGSIAASADGTRLAAAGSGIYISTGPAVSLSPATTYHYRAVGYNVAGSSYGNDLTFTTTPQTTTATTLAASGFGNGIATLNGTVNPDGLATTAYFQYGLTTSYGSFSATNNLAATYANLPVANSISGLALGTTYHFQLVASNSAAVALGGDLTFTTPSSPGVTTLPATGIATTNATLNGTVNPNGLATTAYFQYGLTTTYGSFSATNTLAATNVTLSVSDLLNGLTPGTTYHFQLVASNSVAISLGSDLTFTNQILPGVTTLPATGITASNATLNGTVNPNGLATTAYFQYGLTTSYGYSGGTTTLPATNITLPLPGLLVNSLNSAAGTNWTSATAPVNYWQSIASSADGTRMAALGNGSGIYTSTNSGATWTQTTAPVASWFSIASSADGTRLAAAAKNTGIYTSTNSGATWTQTSAPTGLYWYSIASSADGSRLAAAVYGGGIYTSTNGGSTWTQTSASSTHWYSLASSADGSRLAAVVYGGNIYTSTDGGGTWTAAGAPSANWGAIASSSDGTRLAAAVNGGDIYTSANGGNTWAQTSAPGLNWQSIVSSVDGTRLTAAVFGGGIYTSADGGVAWTQTSAPNANWAFIAASTDSTQLGAVVYNGGIYTSAGSAVDLTPGTTYHYRLVGSSSSGYSYGNDLTFTTLAQAVNFGLKGATKLSGGAFQFSFTNFSGLSFSVWSTTNLAVPWTNWTLLGAPVEAPPGQYKFTDPQGTNRARFYRVRSP